ncbi:MAG: hypothetical protein NWF03_01945, partial [Candidatus Bathyarchaeota archaeon]|nr:hypothetical protein [Candidatus Bathyarchaeota archaeon]
MLVFPAVIVVDAQTEAGYLVSVNPKMPDSPLYTTVGTNWTFCYDAQYSYGENSGEFIENATVSFQVNNTLNEVVDTVLVNTTSGSFSFNYSSSTAQVLTFTPTRLVTEQGTEYNCSLVDAQNSLYGLNSSSVEVWWDTFHVDLVNSNTETTWETLVSVNVTYLLLPEQGLTLPDGASYSGQTFLPKTADTATVTVNGVAAQKTGVNGVYTATVPTWLPTAYIHVAVSQQGWQTTRTGFSFEHTANAPIWTIATIVGVAVLVVVLLFFVFKFKKASKTGSFMNRNYGFFGGILLAVISLISLYWGLVGLTSTLSGFDWILLTISGLLSFGVGLPAAIFSVKRKHQAFVVFTINLPMLTNTVVNKITLDMHNFTNPWTIMLTSFALSLICAFL